MSSISKKDLIRMLVSIMYTKDDLIILKGYDPNRLRTLFFRKCKDDDTKIYTNESHYDRTTNQTIVYHFADKKKIYNYDVPEFDLPEIYFTRGITLMFFVDFNDVFVVNYNRTKEKPISCIRYNVGNREEQSGFMDLFWTERIEEESDLVKLFNRFPRIISDMCSHKDIGAKVLVGIISS
jgi:hypothetical protein